jgi:P2 family phage contractile tail tube protein
MAQIQVNRLTNANVYVDGQSQLGKAEEVNLPDITFMLSEHKALGMIGKFELFSGIDKLEATIKWNAFYADVLKKFADPRKVMKLQIRSSLETYNADGLQQEVACVAYLTVQSKNFPAGNYKQHDNVEATSKLTCTAYKLEIDGQEVVDYDALANIYSVDGVDIFATYRANIGG